MRIEAPGDEGLCSVPFGTTNMSPWRSVTVVWLPSASRIATLELAVKDQEELVGVFVYVPHVLALGVGDANLVIVSCGRRSADCKSRRMMPVPR